MGKQRNLAKRIQKATKARIQEIKDRKPLPAKKLASILELGTININVKDKKE